MYTLARSLGRRTCGVAGLNMIVCGSTTFVSTMGFTNVAKEEGLFGTLGAREYVKTTSSAVNGDPSWNFTPLRSLNSHVRSSIAFQDVASAGTSFWFASRPTRG